MALVNFHPSVHSLAESTKSGISNVSAVEELRKSRKSFFSDLRKSRKSIGAYTSLFTRKLVPPIGFYREADKYHQMQKKFIDDPDKLEALEEMWNDYQKYQIRKRFRWPPKIICKKFFWTTGYYADYQKESRATRLRKPGEDSSDDEFLDPAGQFQIAGAEDDINVEEFERYRQAKKLNQDQNNNQNTDQNRKRMTRFFDESQEDEDQREKKGAQGDQKPNKDKGKGGKGKALKGDVDADLGERRETVTRLFDDNDSDKASQGSKNSERKKRKSKAKPERKPGDPSEEVETTVQVEYTLIKDPNKKKKKSKAAKSVAVKGEDRASVASTSSRKKSSSETTTQYIPGLTAEESAQLAKTYNQALAAGANTTDPQIVAKRKSVTKTVVDPKMGGATVEADVGEDEYVPAKHSLKTLSTIWDTKDDTLKKQYSTHTLTVTNLPDKANIDAMAKLFPGAKVNLKTPKKPGDLPYATVRFKDAEVCKKYFLGDANNIMLDGKKLEIKPKVVKRMSIAKR